MAPISPAVGRRAGRWRAPSPAAIGGRSRRARHAATLVPRAAPRPAADGGEDRARRAPAVTRRRRADRPARRRRDGLERGSRASAPRWAPPSRPAAAGRCRRHAAQVQRPGHDRDLEAPGRRPARSGDGPPRRRPARPRWPGRRPGRPPGARLGLIVEARRRARRVGGAGQAERASSATAAGAPARRAGGPDRLHPRRRRARTAARSAAARSAGCPRSRSGS